MAAVPDVDPAELSRFLDEISALATKVSLVDGEQRLDLKMTGASLR